MPSELRILRFKMNEVGEALRSLGPRIGLDVPEADFISAVAASEDSPYVSFAMAGRLESVTISNSNLAASLIYYCKILGIPLPRNSKKSIYVSSKFVELRVGIRHTQASLDADLTVELQA